jgi:hypothetical protein
MEVNSLFHARAALPPGESPWYPLDRRLGGPQSWSGHCGEEKNLALPGIKPGPSSPFTIPTELPRLLFLCASKLHIPDYFDPKQIKTCKSDE